MVTSKFHIDHVGWITDNLELFEAFWCGILGYHLIKETSILPELTLALFGFKSGGVIRRYGREGSGPDIEIHVFDKGSVRTVNTFDRSGINHICLFTGGPGSREEFLKQLDLAVPVYSFNNPKGWMNYFITDYEGNWIELRENF